MTIGELKRLLDGLNKGWDHIEVVVDIGKGPGTEDMTISSSYLYVSAAKQKLILKK